MSPCGRMLKLLCLEKKSCCVLGGAMDRLSTISMAEAALECPGGPCPRGVGRGGRIGKGILQGGLRSHSLVVRRNHSWGLRGSHTQGPMARWAQIEIWQGPMRGHIQQW